MGESSIMVGVAKLAITPPFGCEMSGFIARRGGAAGVHDPLWAKALVISDGREKVALVVADLIGIDSEIVSEVRALTSRLTDIPAGHVILGATHTHSGPAVLRHAYLGKADPAYLACLIKNLAGSVFLASQALEPVRVLVGQGECGGVGKNRRKPGGPTDPEVLVLRFEGKTGIKALLVNYACHPVVLGPDNLLISADYPFYLASLLEQVYPGAQIMFVN
ncbi:MAG TPA: alkaline ceramidase, partial [Firmicutes bacterium]|nr:alkaline ceramidase [Bacillota bacterium]